MFSFEQLRGFVAVAEELHFRRAADRLRITQPPLSRAIQKLERDLGAALFERGTRSVRLTPAGHSFLLDARRILAAAERSHESARLVASGMAGTIAIGFTAMAGVSILPGLLRDCDEHLARVALTLNELVSHAQAHALARGELDIALVRKRPADPAMRTRLVHRERLVAAVPARGALGASTDALEVSALDGIDMIDYDRSASYFADLVASVLGSAQPRSRQRVSQVHTMLALVAAGRGFAIVPESATTFHLDGVAVRPLAEWRRPVVEVRAAWDASNPNAALHRALQVVPALQPIDAEAATAD